MQKRLSLIGDGIGHVAVAGSAPAWPFGTVADLDRVWSSPWRSWRWPSSGSARAAAPATSPSRLSSTAGSPPASSSAGRSATNANLQPYLFGSILTATDERRLDGVIGLGAVIVVAIPVTGRALLAVVLDADSARVAGIPAGILNHLLATLTAVTVGEAMRIVGVLLIAALMVLPVAASRMLARSFRQTLLGAVAIGTLSVVIGLTGPANGHRGRWGHSAHLGGPVRRDLDRRQRAPGRRRRQRPDLGPH